MHARFNLTVMLSAVILLAGCQMMGDSPTPTPTASPTPTPSPQPMAFAATLSGDQEAPPVTTDGSGTGTFTFDPQNIELSYDITFSGLSGPVTVAHFHNAPTGVSGGVVFDISSDFAGGVMMVSGTWPMTAEDVNELMDGNIYVNIHTDQNPAGEIRGQLIAQ